MRLRFLGAVSALLAMMIGAGAVLAQPAVPSFTFVRDSAGNVWMVADGQKYSVAFYPASDAQIQAIPDSGQWVVPNETGSMIMAGDRPSWAGDVPSAALAPASDIAENGVVTIPRGGKIRVTVHRLTDPARSSNQFNKPDGRWVLVEATVENIGTDSYSFNPLSLKLQTDESYSYTRGNHAGHSEPDLRLTTLGPGQKTRGYLAFDVPGSQRITALLFETYGSPQVVVYRP